MELLTILGIFGAGFYYGIWWQAMPEARWFILLNWILIAFFIALTKLLEWNYKETFLKNKGG
jgi:hypothetical protein